VEVADTGSVPTMSSKPQKKSTIDYIINQIEETHTFPSITQAILDHLQHWHDNTQSVTQLQTQIQQHMKNFYLDGI